MDPAALAQRIAEMQAELTRMSARVTELAMAQATAVPAHGADALTAGLTVFVLACFVGYYVVWNVTPALHSPLMSVTNAISSVIIVGAILAAGLSTVGFSETMGFLAVVLASVNIFGGFVVTQRMLSKFRRKEKAKP
jgi:NAD(P) transhydrogenase subunit alpha